MKKSKPVSPVSSFRRPKAIFRTAAALVAAIAVAAAALYVTRRSNAATLIWDGGGATNNWSEAANWSTDTVPAPGDVVVFDSTSSKHAVIDIDVSVNTLNLNAGYAGTVTMAPGSDVTTASMSVAQGTFGGGDGTLDTGSLSVSGTGVFNAPTGTLVLRGALSVFRPLGAVFNAGAGSVEIRGTNVPVFIDGNTGASVTFNNLRIELSANNSQFGFDANGGLDGAIVNGTLTLVNGVLGSGYLGAAGPVDYQPTFDGGIGTFLSFGGTAALTIQLPAGAPMIGYTSVQNPNATVEIVGASPTSFANRLDVSSGTFSNGSSNVSATDIQQTGGTFNLGAGTTLTANSIQQSGGTLNGQAAAAIDLTSLTISGTAVFNAPSESVYLTNFLKFGAGVQFNTNNGTFVFDGLNNTISVDGNTSGAVVFYNLTLNSTQDNGSLSLDSNGGLDAPYSTGTVRLQNGQLANSLIYYTGNMVVDAGFDGGAGALWAYGGGQQTFTGSGGVLPTGQFTVAKSGGTYTLVSDLILGTSQTFQISGGEVDMGTAGSIRSGNLTIGSGGSLRSRGTGDITLGGSLTNSGKLDLIGGGSCPGDDVIQIRSTVDGTQRNWGGAGKWRLVNVDIRDMAASPARSANSSTDSGNNTNWTFDPSCPVPLAISPQTVSKYVNQTETFAASGGIAPYSFSLAANNSGGSINASSGLYTAGPNFDATDTVRVTDSFGDTGDATVTVTAGPPVKLGFTVQPSNTVAGQSISPSIKVAIQDANGNTVSNATSAVTIAFGNNAGSGSLGGTLTRNAVAGVATFDNITIDKAAAGYTLNASSAGLTGATSSPFDITFGAPAKLAFTVQPTNTTGTFDISPAPAIAVQDAFGNLVTNATNAVTVGLATNPSGGTLTGVLTRNAISGIATFPGLKINTVGNGYQLSASAASITGATSASFDILSPFVVRNANAVGVGSLFSAIAVAKTTPGTQTITFDIPGPGPHVINVSLPFDAITDPVVIDGTTQPGFAGTPIVEIRGNGATPDATRPAIGFRLSASGSTIRGLAIGGFAYAGIQIFPGSNGNTVEGNYIGTDASGQTGNPNNRGIFVQSSNNTIGGNTAAKRNVISGSLTDGVLISPGTSGNSVIGNLIGTAADGTTPRPNNFGLNVSGNAVIGGTGPNQGNVIAGNNLAGVLVNGGVGTTIRGNSIHSNGGLGIDLASTGVTANDNCDSDTGANGRQNFPLIDSFTTLGGTTTVTGTFNSKPNATYTLDFYASDVPDPSGYGEGRTWIGAQTVSTGANCSLTTSTFAFNAPAVPPTARFVTATATDSAGNTSEFSPAFGQTVTIAGTFRDGSNAPIAGVSVQLRNLVSGPIIRTMISGSDGRFAFAGLAPDANYHLYAYKANHVFTPSTKAYNALATSVDEQWNGAINYLSITGRVTSSGSAVGGVTVTLSGAASHTTVTDSAGNYSFPNLLGGVYTVTPSKTNFLFSPGSQTLSLTVNTPVNFTATNLMAGLTGKILYLSGGNLRSINANGTGDVAVVNSTYPNNLVGDSAISRDGAKIVMNNPATGLETMAVDGSARQLILPNSDPGRIRFWKPRWNPDGTRIAFVADLVSDNGKVRHIAATGGSTTTVAPLQTTDQPSWSPDGAEILFRQIDTGIFKAPAFAGSSSLVAAGDLKFDPHWNAALSKVFFGENSGGFYWVKSVNPDGSGEQVIYQLDAASVFSFSLDDLSPTGERVLIQTGTSGLRSFDAATGLGLVNHVSGWGATWGRTPFVVTPPGSPVTINSGRAGVTFGSVAARDNAAGTGGETTVELARPEAVGDAPSGYSFSQFAYRVETDAVYSGPVTFCIDVPADRYLTPQQFAALRILHLEGGTLVDRTDLPPNFADRKVCGTANTLGHFVLAEAIDPAMPSIVGQVVDANGDPVVDHMVSLEGDESRFVQTDQQGWFAFRNLAAGGNYSVRPNAVGFTFDQESVSFDQTTGENIAVFRGSRQSHSVRGRVTDGNGSPIANVRMSLGGSEERETTTDVNGEYVFADLPANAYLTISGRLPAGTSLTGLVLSPAIFEIDQLASDTVGVDFTAVAPTAAGASVAGRVRAPNGAGLRDVEVTISGGGLSEPMTVRTNQLGRFRFDSIPTGSTYVVSVSSRRYLFGQPSRVLTLDDDALDLEFVSEQ